MTCYLIHFDRPFSHARHYLGFVERQDMADDRLMKHYRGNGAKLMRHVTNEGITWRLVRVWPEADRTRERALKKAGGHARKCPICCGREKPDFRLPIAAAQNGGGGG